MSSIRRRFDRRSAYVASLVVFPLLAFAGAHCSSSDSATPSGGDAGADANVVVGQDSGSVGDDAGNDATVADDAPASDDASGDATQGDDGSIDGSGDTGVDTGIDAGVDSGPVNAGPPTFTNIYTNVFQVYCTSCHGASPPVGNSNFKMGTQVETYGNLVGDGGGVPAMGVACGADGGVEPDGGPVPRRVVPGDANASLLFRKVNDSPPSCGERMPFGGSKLPADLIALIQTWINQGAPEN